MTRFTATFSDTVVSATNTRKLSIVQRILRALTVRRERRALLSLDERMLADVGLSQADAYREANRPFLDVSATVRHTNTW